MEAIFNNTYAWYLFQRGVDNMLQLVIFYVNYALVTVEFILVLIVDIPEHRKAKEPSQNETDTERTPLLPKQQHSPVVENGNGRPPKVRYYAVLWLVFT